MIIRKIRNRLRVGLAAAGIATLASAAGALCVHAADAGQDAQVLPVGTVVCLRLDVALSSKTARPGDPFTATVRLGPDGGAAGLPDGTRVEGVVTEALPAANGLPGVLDMDFRRVLLTGSSSAAQNIQGALVSMGAQSVRRDASTGAFLDTFVASGAGGLFDVRGMAFGPVTGLSDTPAVPEPSTLVFLGTGVPVLGLALRRRKANGRTARANLVLKSRSLPSSGDADAGGSVKEQGQDPGADIGEHAAAVVEVKPLLLVVQPKTRRQGETIYADRERTTAPFVQRLRVDG